MRWLKGYLLLNGVPGIIFVIVNFFFAENIADMNYGILSDSGIDNAHIILNQFYAAVLAGFTIMTLASVFINEKIIVRVMVLAVIIWNAIEIYLWWIVINSGGEDMQGFWTHVVLAVLGILALAISYRSSSIETT